MMNDTVVMAKLFARPNGHVGQVILWIFECGPVGLDLMIEVGVPLVGCCITIDDVTGEHPENVFIDFAKDLTVASRKLIKYLNDKLGCRVIADNSDEPIIELA